MLLFKLFLWWLLTGECSLRRRCGLSMVVPMVLLFLIPIWLSAQEPVRFVQKDGQIEVWTGDRQITTWWFDSTLSKPILYPIFSPSGARITRRFPFEDVAGESHDHPHHTGLSFTYSSNHEVNGNSFWANPHDKLPVGDRPRLPAIRQVALERMKATPDHGLLSVTNHWLNGDGEPVLIEERTMQFSTDLEAYYIDFTIELTPFDTTVIFEDTKEGMFSIRVADWLAEDANGTAETSTGTFTNAEGEKTEKNVWGKQSAWMNLEGNHEGKSIGISVLHHPSSLNFPTYWHARGYGCFAANPVGQYDYQKGRNQSNPERRQLKLNEGEKALFKFRLIIYEGSRSKASMDADFERYRQG